MSYVHIDNLSFSYDGGPNLVLKGVELAADQGDFVCLLGQSGCGKSTVLRLLAGLEVPTSGSIKVDGKPVSGTSLERSVVFQDYGLFPWMSAGENIVLALRQRFPKKSKRECVQIARDALSKVGLPADVFGKYPKELSGGMQQRCAIAQAFSLDPAFLLMDEPFGALDAVTRSRLQDMVLNLWSSQTPKKTVFFVTHDVEEALLLATKVVVLGQKPSSVIFQRDIPGDARRTRADLYERADIIELRTQLLSYINRDVESHADQQPAAATGR